MKTHVAVAAKNPAHDTSKKTWGWLQLFKEPTVQLLAVSFLVSVVALWWLSARLQMRLIESLALEHAQAYTQMLRELGGAYMAEPSARTKLSFAALLVKAGGAPTGTFGRVTQKFYNMESSGQGKSNEPQPEFVQEAWHALAQNSDQPLSRFEEIQGQLTLRYVVGWKEGEIKGVLETLVPLQGILAGSERYRTTLLVLFGIASVLCGCLVTLLLRWSRREVKAADLRVIALEHEFTEQEKIIRMYEREMSDRTRQEGEILAVAEVLAAVTGDLLNATNELAASATEMAAAVNETTSTVEEVKQTALLSSQKSQQVSAAAQTAAQISQSGQQATEDTIVEMQRIRDQMQSIADSIVKLSEQNQTIRDIIDTVNDLAEQSNVLAVNASIEAQKVGVYGSGFSVVAQEVRNLARQSKEATVQVQAILNDIEKATNAAVQITAQGAGATEAGMKQSTEAGESIRALAQNIQDAAHNAVLIAASNQQQAVGMDQLVQAMHSIQEGSVQTITSMQQVEVCVHRLRELETRLTMLSDRLTGTKRAQIVTEPASMAEAA